MDFKSCEIILPDRSEIIDFIRYRDYSSYEPESFEYWQLLEYEKCPICPLTGDEKFACPAAVSVGAIVNLFANVNSYERVKLVLDSLTGRFSCETDAQNACFDLFAYSITNSGCPKLFKYEMISGKIFLRGGLDEFFMMITLAIFAENFYGKNYVPETDDIMKNISEMGTVIEKLGKRLSGVAVKDASLNALASFLQINFEITDNFDEYMYNLRMRLKKKYSLGQNIL